MSNINNISPLNPKQLLNILLTKNIQSQYCQQSKQDAKNNKNKIKNKIGEYQTKIKQINSKNKSILAIIQKRDTKIRQLQQVSLQRKKTQLKLQIEKNRLKGLASQAQMSKRNGLRQNYRFYLHNNQQIKFKISQIKQYIQKMECQNKKLIQQKNTFKLIKIRQNSVQNLTKQWFDKVESIKRQFLTDQMEFNRLKIMCETKQLINNSPFEANLKLTKCGSLNNLFNTSYTMNLLQSRKIPNLSENDTIKKYEKSLSKVKSLTSRNFYPSYQSIYK